MSIVNHVKTFLLLLVAAFLMQGAWAAAWIEPNVGQSAGEYDYVIRAKGLTALVAGQHVDFLVPARLQQSESPEKQGRANVPTENLPGKSTSHSLRLQLVNARDEAKANPGKMASIRVGSDLIFIAGGSILD